MVMREALRNSGSHCDNGLSNSNFRASTSRRMATAVKLFVMLITRKRDSISAEGAEVSGCRPMMQASLSLPHWYATEATAPGVSVADV